MTIDCHRTPWFWLAALLACCAGAVSAWGVEHRVMGKASRYLVQSWAVDDGLPHSHVTAVRQSSDGYLWVGTLDGMARFDGVRFTQFDSDTISGIENDRITAVVERVSGELWIGTDGGGAVRKRGREFRSFTTDDGLGEDRISALHANADGSLWVGTRGGKLNRWDGTRFMPVTSNVPAGPDGKMSLVADADGRVWVGGAGALDVVENGVAKPVLREVNDRFALVAGRKSVIWAVAGRRIWRIEAGTIKEEARLLPGAVNSVSAVFEDASGVLWVGTEGRGLYSRTAGGWEHIGTAEGLPHQYVASIAQDDEGNLWVGSFRGLSRINRRLFERYDERNALSSSSALSVCEGADGTMWIGTDGGGLNAIRDGRVSAYSAEDGLLHESVWSVIEDRAGRVWVGTWGGGLHRRVDGRFASIGVEEGVTSSIIRALYEDRRGRIWAGSHDQGAFVLANGAFRRIGVREGLPGEAVRCFLETRDGSIWVGTSAGLARSVAPGAERFERVPGLPTELIRCLFEDGDGRLWVGTGDEGVAFLDDGRFRLINTRKGLVDDQISHIASDGEGRLWFGSSKGIFRAPVGELIAAGRTAGAIVRCVSYTDADGLSRCSGALQPAGWKAPDGSLLFAMATGVARVRPGEVPTLPLPPRVLIEEVAADGEEVLFDTHARVSSQSGNIQFQYTAISHSGPRRIQFRHQLVGRDVNWVEAGAGRVASYSGLEPGQYEFRVIACNKDGVWNELGGRLALVVIPAWWQTAWFRGLALASLAILFVVLARLVFTWRLRRRLVLAEAEQALLKERARIAKDMHDDVGARLTQLAILSDVVARQASAGQATAARRLGEVSRDAVRQLDEVVWTVNPRNDNLENVINYLIHYATEFAETAGMRCRIDAPPQVAPTVMPSGVRHQLLMAFKEALNNAVKHAGSKEIHVGIGTDATGIELRITDFGRGFDAASPGPGEGVGNLRERMSAAGGTCEITSRPGAGTSVILRLPLAMTNVARG